MKKQIGDRLRLLREENGLSQQLVATKVGISDSSYQNYEYGKRDVPGDVLKKFSALYNVTVDYILGISKFRNKQDQINATTGTFVDAPVVGSIAAGVPIEMIEVEETFPLAKEKHDEFPNAFFLRVKGESMNRILPNGVLALIDPCDTIDYDNAPYAICVNGFDATIKRVHKLNNGFELVPDSNDPTFKTAVYDYGVEGTEVITPIGRVVYDVKPFDWRY